MFKRVIPFLVAVFLFVSLAPMVSNAAEELNSDFNQVPIVNPEAKELTNNQQYETNLILPPGTDTWIMKAAAEDAAAKIPKKLKKSDDVVDLGKFKDKYGNTPVTKNSGEFKNGEWSIDKDTAGHTGYDGTVKKWKIKKNGNRIGSLNKDGKVIDG